MLVGVIRFDGSLTRSRVKFCDSPTIRPMFNACSSSSPGGDGLLSTVSNRIRRAVSRYAFAAAAVASMETQVLEATAHGSIEGVILRYGMFYGLEVPSTIAMIDMVRRRRLPVIRNDSSQLPIIHLEDTVSATLRALDIAPTGSIYDIVDDRAVRLSEIVEAIAEYTNSPKPFKVPAWLPKLVSPYLARMTSTRLPL